MRAVTSTKYFAHETPATPAYMNRITSRKEREPPKVISPRQRPKVMNVTSHKESVCLLCFFTETKIMDSTTAQSKMRQRNLNKVRLAFFFSGNKSRLSMMNTT